MNSLDDHITPPNTDVFRFELLDAELVYIPNFFSEPAAGKLFHQLINELAFESGEIKLFGKTMNIPRLQAWYGDPGLQYTYSGTTLTAHPWPATLNQVKNRIIQYCEHPFNAALCNLYRDHQDSVGWHADNEPELGSNPVIASISLGAERLFQMKHKKNKHERWQQVLEHGSLLVMKGPTQHNWLHQLPKSRTSCGERINLTFRNIFP